MRLLVLLLGCCIGLLGAHPVWADDPRAADEAGEQGLLADAPAAALSPAEVIDAALLEPVAKASKRLDRRAGDAYLVGGQGKAYESPWKLQLGIAASLARGNNETVDVLIDGRVNYERNKVAAELKAAYVYGEAQGTKNSENWHVQGRFDRKLRGKGYLFFKYNFDQDRFADLEYRHTAIGGWGYSIIDREKTKLNGELGAGMAWEQRLTTPPTANPSAYVGLDFAHEWGEGNTFTLEYDFVPYLNDFDLSYMTWDAKFGTPVCQGVDITIGIRVNWVFEPPSPTKPVDLLLAVGVRLDV